MALGVGDKDKSVMIGVRHLVQQLGQMEDAHEELIGAFKSRGIMTTLKEVLDNQARGSIGQYHKRWWC